MSRVGKLPISLPDKVTVKVGDFTQTYDHASLSAAKTNLSVGFSFGTVSVKDVVVEK